MLINNALMNSVPKFFCQVYQYCFYNKPSNTSQNELLYEMDNVWTSHANHINKEYYLEVVILNCEKYEYMNLNYIEKQYSPGFPFSSLIRIYRIIAGFDSCTSDVYPMFDGLQIREFII